MSIIGEVRNVSELGARWTKSANNEALTMLTLDLNSANLPGAANW
jgi:hypothetical protein